MNQLLEKNTPIILKDWEDLYISRNIIVLAAEIGVSIYDILKQIPIDWTNRSKPYFEKIWTSEAKDTAEVIYATESDTKLEFPDHI